MSGLLTYIDRSHPPPGVSPVIVKQIWAGNAYRNFNYLIACPETGDALVVDVAA